MESVSIEEARRTLGDLVDRARIAGEATLVMRYRTPAAILVNADWYHQAAACLEREGSGDVQ
jgi:PHD/YefM family antitoxin component YafN of YafNO toxin-antitoxin module